ncbi:MAG: hypothetical protein MZV70_08510 [Desulfobacterales bacterium]|nr:hypothetical protein [Desulfobacterales bacterium]
MWRSRADDDRRPAADHGRGAGVGRQHGRRGADLCRPPALALRSPELRDTVGRTWQEESARAMNEETRHSARARRCCS